MVTLFVEEVKNLKEKVTGLIGKDKPSSLFLKTHFGIHTFGLKFPIDVLVLDGKNEIVSVKQNLKPGRIFLWNPRYNKVLELPPGTIDEKKIKINDTVELKSQGSLNP